MTDASIFDNEFTKSKAHTPSASKSLHSAPPDVDNNIHTPDTRDKIAQGAANSGGMAEKISGIFGKAGPKDGKVVAGEQQARHEQANRDLNRE